MKYYRLTSERTTKKGNIVEDTFYFCVRNDGLELVEKISGGISKLERITKKEIEMIKEKSSFSSYIKK
mgnify:CR=1 FL=1